MPQNLSDRIKRINWQKVWLTLGIGAGIIFLSAFVTSQLIFPLLFGRPKNIEVPDLVGKNLAWARRELVDLGLHVVVKDSIWSENDRVDTILDQDPKPGGKARPESSVYLLISRGSKIAAVPSIIGVSYHEAYFTLRSVDLKATVVDSLYSDSYSVNTVIRCSPVVGSKVEKNSKIRLWLSRGPEPAREEAPPDTTVQTATEDDSGPEE